MNTQEATAWTADSWEKQAIEHRGNILQVGSRVRVTSYGPFRGLRGKPGQMMLDSGGQHLPE